LERVDSGREIEGGWPRDSEGSGGGSWDVAEDEVIELAGG